MNPPIALFDTVVLAAPGHEALAASLASQLGGRLVDLESRRFPDGERYVRIAGNLDGASVVVAATLRDPDPQLATLLFMADAAREQGASRVGLAAPYLAYLRQDRRFRDGEAVTSRTFAKVISGSFDWLVTMDPHLHRYAGLDEIYAIPSAVAHAAADLSLWIRDNVEDPIVIGPDSESEQWAREVAKAARAPIAVLAKTRHGDRDVEIDVVGTEVGARTPVLVDDIISSAKTMAVASRELQRRGSRPPVCIGVHAVFADGAEELLRQAGVAGVFTTNTIAHPTNRIEVTPALARAMTPLLQPAPA